MQARCPHCGEPITIIGATEMEERYGVNRNRQQHLRTQGRFPEPWIKLENRNLYLQHDIEEWLRQDVAGAAELRIGDLESLLASLPEGKARTEVMSRLRQLVE